MPPEKQNICPTCGSFNPTDAPECRVCGESLRVAASVAPATAAPAEAPRNASTAVEPERVPAATASASGRKICANCGGKNPPEARFCNSCGSPFSAGGSGRPSQRQAEGKSRPKQAKPSSQKQSRPGNKNAGITFSPWQLVALIAVFFAALVIMFYIMNRNSSDTAPADAATAASQHGPDLAMINELKAYAASHPEDADAMLRCANALQDARMYGEAIDYYRRYLERNPSNVNARVDLGVCYFDLDDFTPAIKEMEEAVRLQPNHQLGTFNLGIVNLKAGNQAKAMEWFRKAVTLDPASASGKSAQQLIDQHASD